MSKSVLVDINENDNIKYLLRKIGERMEETHDDFRGLRHCQATQIFQVDNLKGNDSPFEASRRESRQKEFTNNMVVKNCLKNGDQVYFEIDTLDLWINAQIVLSLGNKNVITVKA